MSIIVAILLFSMTLGVSTHTSPLDGAGNLNRVPSSDRSATQVELNHYYLAIRELALLKGGLAQLRRQYTEAYSTSKRFWRSGRTRNKLGQIVKSMEDMQFEIASKERIVHAMERTFTVMAWQDIQGKIQKVEVNLESIAGNNRSPILNQNEFQLFFNHASFDLWNEAQGNIKTKIAYYAQSNPYLMSCLIQKPQGTKIKVDATWTSECNKSLGLSHQAKKRYELSRLDDEIVISASLYFKWDDDPDKKLEAMGYVKETLPCMKDFYARHGIRLELKIWTDTGSEDRKNSDHVINLKMSQPVTNALNWPAHRANGHKLGAKHRCGIYLHELGHLLGLADTNADPSCPDRKVGEADDIMRVTYDPGPLKVYPEAIKEILSPLCGN